MTTMPAQKPGRSKQDYGTPCDLLDAVKRRLGIDKFWIDLAASDQNTVAPRWYTDAFAVSWVQSNWETPGWAWLNPPFAHIRPWVQKAYLESRVGARIAMLVPAAVGSNWWASFVEDKAFALALNGRITFVGEKDPYIKDCALLLYGPDIAPGFRVWRWMEKLSAASAAAK